MKREQKITLGKAGIAFVREKIRRVRALAFGPAAASSSPRWPHWCCCRSRSAMPAGCRMSSKARQSPANRLRTSPRQSTPPRPSAPLRQNPTCKSRVKLAALGPANLNLPLETGRDGVRSLEIPDRSGCGTYRRIGRRDQRPQRRRVHLQSAPCAADRGEIEGRRLCRDEAARDRRQGQAQPRQARRRCQRICTRISSCRSTTTPCPTHCSRTGNSRARKAISATASAAIPSSSPATIRISRRASRSPNWSPRK